jgi:hypothetical protein
MRGACVLSVSPVQNRRRADQQQISRGGAAFGPTGFSK